MKRKHIHFLFVLCVCMFVGISHMAGGSIPVTVMAASSKDDGNNMKKVLKYYHKKQYSTAQKYNKKLSEYAGESCVSSMPSGMKKAYRKVVRGYKTDSSAGGSYMWDYYLTDIDNDRKADLIVKAGTCEGDVMIIVYQYRGGKAKKVGSVEGGHTGVYAFPNHSGVVLYGGLMQGEWMNLLTVKSGKLRVKHMGTREEVEPYFSLRCSLKSYVQSQRLDLSPLK